MNAGGPVEPSREHITWALIQAVRLWANAAYSAKLRNGGADAIEPAWFKAFLGNWSVARTIKEEHQEDVLKYLNGRFRLAIAKDKRGMAVTSGAKYIAKRGWTHQDRKTKKRRVPISLVAKISFFLHPSRFVPLDRYSRIGVNRLRGGVRAGGEGHAPLKSYETYLSEFNKFFREYEHVIAHEATRPWVRAIATGLGCPVYVLSSSAFRRKVFDNVLLGIGTDR
jgi:hypothetical protein